MLERHKVDYVLLVCECLGVLMNTEYWAWCGALAAVC